MSNLTAVVHFPTLNAALNFTSAVFLSFGYFFIRQKRIVPHKICMVAAFFTSSIFLVSYLYYHAHAGHKPFTGTGWIRPIYFSILISHTTLAAVIVPLILVTLRWALKGDFERHARMARWTWPLWMYVSVTGVIVYFMLYLR